MELEVGMSLLKISVLLTGLLSLLVIVLAYFTFSLSSEVQQLRGDMAVWQQDAAMNGQDIRDELTSLKQTVDNQGQEFDEELVSLRKEVRQLVTLGKLTTQFGTRITSQEALTIGVQGSSWIAQDPESVKTIRRSEYGTDWPFPTDEALIGCHGRDVIVVVDSGEYMVGGSPANLHSFLPDVKDVSIFDPSSPQMDSARERLTEDGRTLCRGMR